MKMEEIFREYSGYAGRLGKYVGNTSVFIDREMRKGKHILFEGAQGTHLDVDHGTYPFVTSSNPTSGGACTGSGIAPNYIGKVIGVCKAYMTRVGNGAFPTELFDQTGEDLGRIGHEFGATTGRKRRCGWLDGVVLAEAARLNSLTGLAVTKLDVLTGLDPLRICLGYDLDGERIGHVPASLEALARCRPVYEEWPGWTEDIEAARAWEDLPAAARDYLNRISELAGAPLALVSVGPGRESTIELSDPFAGD